MILNSHTTPHLPHPATNSMPQCLGLLSAQLWYFLFCYYYYYFDANHDPLNRLHYPVSNGLAVTCFKSEKDRFGEWERANCACSEYQAVGNGGQAWLRQCAGASFSTKMISIVEGGILNPDASPCSLKRHSAELRTLQWAAKDTKRNSEANVLQTRQGWELPNSSTMPGSQ